MRAGVLIDTHVLIWLVTGGAMRGEAVRAISEAVADGAAYVSAVSGWEVGLLARKRRPGALTFSGGPEVWFEHAVQGARLREISLDWRTAVAVSSLPDLAHGDPADRMLIATARRNDLTLLTRDRPILDYAALGHVRALAC